MTQFHASFLSTYTACAALSLCSGCGNALPAAPQHQSQPESQPAVALANLPTASSVAPGALLAPSVSATNDLGQATQDGALTAGAAVADSPALAADSAALAAPSAVPPTGWLYTNGNKIYKSNGAGGGAVWVGRGVNLDDLFLCGYNNSLWYTGAEQALKTIINGLMSQWKPNFVRLSLGMNSYRVVSWLNNPALYKTPMTNVINAIGAYPNTYVLVTLRSDASMIGYDTASGDPEPTGLPSDSTNTPNRSAFPSGTDAVYRELVNSFANAKYVAFGLSNEPGGNKLSNTRLKAAMQHAVAVIRGEEDRLRVPHHLVFVQGNNWTSNIGFYAAAPIPYDNVVYEVHGYPPSAASYTFANIPVALGEYGGLTTGNAPAFYADLEAKKISNLAWDFEPFSDCSPDLLTITRNAQQLNPTPWGSIVQNYLRSHAP